MTCYVSLTNSLVARQRLRETGGTVSANLNEDYLVGGEGEGGVLIRRRREEKYVRKKITNNAGEWKVVGGATSASKFSRQQFRQVNGEFYSSKHLLLPHILTTPPFSAQLLLVHSKSDLPQVDETSPPLFSCTQHHV